MPRSYRQQSYTQSDTRLDRTKGEEKVRSKVGLYLPPCGCDLSQVLCRVLAPLGMLSRTTAHFSNPCLHKT